MLLNRCPNLQQLTITTLSDSPCSLELLPLMAGRWPSLRSLTLGDFVVEATSFSTHAAFGAFLAAHPQLTDVRFDRRARVYIYASTQLQTSLPGVEVFSSAWQDLQALKNPELVRCLRLMTDVHRAQVLPAVCGMLHKLGSLRTLEIWLDFSAPGSDWKYFGSIFVACPQLQHLRITLSTPLAPNLVCTVIYFLHMH